MDTKHAARAKAMVLFAISLSMPAVPSQAQTTIKPVAVLGSFQGEKGVVAADLSGVACAPRDTGGSQLCLLVNDEGSAAQWATLKAGSMTVGTTVDLRAALPPPESAAGTKCPGGYNPAKQEVDGEAVSYSAPYFYVIGSHGCSRNKGRFSLPAFRIYRVEPGATKAVAASDRVANEMKTAPELASYVERPLDELSNGASIEGLAFVDREMMVGFRSPSVDAMAPILAINAAAAFGTEASARRIIWLPLGLHTGIRDLAALPDGRMIVLSGPSQDQVGAFGLQVRSATGTISPVAGWSRPAGGTIKAEAVTVLSASADTAELLLVYEGVPNGAPEIITIALPQSVTSDRQINAYGSEKACLAGAGEACSE